MPVQRGARQMDARFQTNVVADFRESAQKNVNSL